MKSEDWLAIAAVGLFFIGIISQFKFLKDPYYHMELVDPIEWANREIEELKTGERE